MKKIILVVLLALSLYGSESMCRYAVAEEQKSAKLFTMALEREDVIEFEYHANEALTWIERALVECDDGWYGRKNAEKIRDILMKITGVKRDTI